MKKWIAIALCLMMTVALMPFALHTASADDSGKCGDNLNWSFNDSTGKLTITGSGAMYDFGYDIETDTYHDSAPWPWDAVKSVSLPSGLTSIGRDAFRYQTQLTSITIPNSVTSIGYCAFDSCTELTTVKLGSGLKSIGEYAFSYCSGLTSITIPSSVTSIGIGAFSDCTALTSITIPSSVTSIGIDAFYGCTGLTSVTLGSGLKTIGNYAFGECEKLTSITIPASVTSIGDCTFYYCTGLTKITVSSQNKKYCAVNGVLFSYDKTKLIAYPCSKTGTSYSVPEGVTSLEKSAFVSCTNLKTITLPATLTGAEGQVFQECSSLTEIKVASQNKSLKSVDGVLFSYDGKKLIAYPDGKQQTSYTIPSSVTEIQRRAFAYNEKLTSITIPSSVTSIGESAFRNCKSLTSITIPNSVTSIGEYAFIHCKGLKSVKLGSGIKSISDRAFGYCEKLTSITIPNSVTSIGDYAFRNCTGLTSITIPNSVTSIGDSAFYGCAGLTSVTLGSGLKTIGNYAFGECEKLTSITIPSRVTSIGDGSFYLCTGLTSITFPNSVASIGEWAFDGCTGLTSVKLGSGVKDIGPGAFYNCENLKKVLYCGMPEQKDGISIGAWNETLENATWYYIIGTQPKSATVKTGEAAKFTVTVFSGVSGVTYQWYYSKDNGSTWTKWSGKTSATLSLIGSETNNGYLYRCEVKNSYGSVTSSSAKLTVSDVKPKITSQPAAKTVASGKAATFKVVAAGSGLSYQWQYSKNNGSTWTSWSGKTSATLSVTGSETNNGYLYRCEVTNSYGSVTSKAAKLTVSGVKPKITVQPASQTVTSGKAVTFKVVAAGSGLSYQWQYSKNNGSTWTSWSGKTSATLSVTGSETNNGYLYRCEVTNSYGSVTSKAAKLTVSGVKPKITAQPAAQTVTSGKAVTFKVVAAGSGLSYQWQYSKNNGSTWTNWSGKTSASLSLIGNEKNNGYQYRCVVTNSCGSVTSSSAKLTVTGN